MTEAEADEHLQAAEGFLELGDAVEAWERIDSLPAEVQSSKMALLLRLRILSHQKEWLKLGLLAESMTSYAGELYSPWYCLAVAKAQQGEMPAAKVALNQALVLRPEMREVALLDRLLEGAW